MSTSQTNNNIINKRSVDVKNEREESKLLGNPLTKEFDLLHEQQRRSL